MKFDSLLNLFEATTFFSDSFPKYMIRVSLRIKIQYGGINKPVNKDCEAEILVAVGAIVGFKSRVKTSS